MILNKSLWMDLKQISDIRNYNLYYQIELVVQDSQSSTMETMHRTTPNKTSTQIAHQNADPQQTVSLGNGPQINACLQQAQEDEVTGNPKDGEQDPSEEVSSPPLSKNISVKSKPNLTNEADNDSMQSTYTQNIDQRAPAQEGGNNASSAKEQTSSDAHKQQDSEESKEKSSQNFQREKEQSDGNQEAEQVPTKCIKSCSSDPSSTSSEEERKGNTEGSSSHSSCSASCQKNHKRDNAKSNTSSNQSSTNEPSKVKRVCKNEDQADSSLKGNSKETNQDENSSNHLDTDTQDKQQQLEQRKSSQSGQDDNNENSDSTDSEDEDDEEPIMSQSSIVVETSPKGRFKKFAEELGRGAYKIVYRGVDHETGREIAWNVINLRRLPKQDRIRIKSEIDLIKKLEHKNIIHFISAWINKQKEQVIFITEMITGGSLRKYVKKIKHPRLKVIKSWCNQILQGLVYLHAQKPHPIIHRDLKCDNVFINSNSGEIRIGDLGLSTPMQHSFTTSVLGTPEFMAPELYEECYDTAVDIYAFGMCVLEMITLERPYQECQNPAQIYNKVIQGIRPKALDRIQDKQITDFILQCLNRADKRPSAKNLLESKFLQNLESEKNNQEVKVTPPPKNKFPKQPSQVQLMKYGSTILEEEEENSEDDRELRRLQEPEKNTPIFGQPEPSQSNQHSAVSKTSTANQVEAPTVPNFMETETQQQVQETVEIQSEQQAEELQSDQVQEEMKDSETQDNGGQPDSGEDDKSTSQQDISVSLQIKREKRKQKKEGSKNKKLDESVHFLKKIDKKKQKKLQERSMANQQLNYDKNDDEEEGEDKEDEDVEEDNDDDDDQQQQRPTENILDELKKQDSLEDQQRALTTTSQEFPKTESLKLPETSQQQQQQTQQKFSKPPVQQTAQQPVTPQQVQQNPQVQQNSQAQAVTAEQQEKKKEKRDNMNALLIEKKKNFKEDENLFTTSGNSSIAGHTTPTNIGQQNQSSSQKDIHHQNQILSGAALIKKNTLQKQSSTLNEREGRNSIIMQMPQVQSEPLDIRRTTSRENIFQTFKDHQAEEVAGQQRSSLAGQPFSTNLQLQREHPKPPQGSMHSDISLQSQSNSAVQAKSVSQPIGKPPLEVSQEFDNQSSNIQSDVSDVEAPEAAQRQSEEAYSFIKPQPMLRTQNSTIAHDAQVAQIEANQSHHQQRQQHSEQSLNHGIKKAQSHVKALGGQPLQQYPQSQHAYPQQLQHHGPQGQLQPINSSHHHQPHQQQSASPRITAPQNKQLGRSQQQDLLDFQMSTKQRGQTPIGVQGQSQLQLYPQQQSKQSQQSYQGQSQPVAKSKKQAEDAKDYGQPFQKIQSAPQQKNPQNLQNQDILTESAVSKSKDGSKLNITFKIKGLDGGAEQEVTFDFDINNDTSTGVAKEMVKELGLHLFYIDLISKRIQSLIQRYYHLPLADKTEKKGSPGKISKDFAQNHFAKICENVDLFFVTLQNKGVESLDEFIDAMELNEEEKMLRAEFINSIYKAKKQYKNSYDEYKRKILKKKEQSMSSQHSSTTANSLAQQPQSNKSKPSSQQSYEVNQQQHLPTQQYQDKQSKFSTTTPMSHNNQNALKKLQSSGRGDFSQASQAQNTFKRVSSHNDMSIYQPFHNDQPSQLANDLYFQQVAKQDNIQLRVDKQPAQSTSQRVIVIPPNIRKITQAPNQIVISSRLAINLCRGNQEMSKEDVTALQNVLNIIYQVSLFQQQQQQNPGVDPQQLNNHHHLLKVDGDFGDKTEKLVMKFQDSAGMVPDGIVNDQLFKKLINCVEKFQKEEMRKVQYQQPQQTHKEPKPHAQQHQQQQQVTRQTLGSKDKQYTQPPMQQQPKSQGHLGSSQNFQERRLSPTKYNPNVQQRSQKDIELEDADYQMVIEQVFKNPEPSQLYIQDQQNDYDQYNYSSGPQSKSNRNNGSGLYHPSNEEYGFSPSQNYSQSDQFTFYDNPDSNQYMQEHYFQQNRTAQLHHQEHQNQKQTKEQVAGLHNYQTQQSLSSYKSSIDSLNKSKPDQSEGKLKRSQPRTEDRIIEK